MKFIKPSLVCFFIICSFWSCDRKIDQPFENLVTLERVKTITFEIDSVTKRTSQLVGFSESTNSIYLFNDLNYVLHFFDIDTQENWKSIQLYREGPMGIGKVDRLFAVSPDSIISMSSTTSRLSLITDEGQSVKKIEVFDRDLSDPYLQTHSPSFLYDSKTQTVFLATRPGQTTPRDKASSLSTFNLVDSTKKFLSPWPERFYERGVIGSISYGSLDAYNQYIISHTFQPEIQVVDLKSGDINKHFAGSGLVKIAEPFKGEGGLKNRGIYQMGNSWYGNVYYDKYNDLYLRGARIGRRIPSGGDPANLSYPSLNGDKVYSTTVILDKDFTKIGEVPGLRVSNQIFSTQAGIFIRNAGHQPENEDIIAFNVFKVKQHETLD